MSGVKGCKIKINLEMPNDVFSDSPQVRPHAWYYIYGEPHTYTCWSLSLQNPRMRLQPAPCLGGREAEEGTPYNFHPSILTTLGMGDLVVLCLAFLWEFLHFHLSGNQMEKKEQKELGRRSLFCSETHKNLRLNLQQVVG